MRTDRSLTGAHAGLKNAAPRAASPTSVHRPRGLQLVTALKWMAWLVVIAAAYSVLK